MRKKTPWFVFVVAYMNLTFLHYSLVGYPPRVSFFPAFSCCFSVTKSCLTLCNPMECSTPGFPFHHQLLELAQTHVHLVGDAIQPSHPLLSPSPAFPIIRVFSSESVLHIRWPEYWSFSFSISPSSEYSGPISFMIDWFELLAVQGTLQSLLQHHSSKGINSSKIPVH